MPEAELARRLQDRNLVLVPRGEGPFPAVLLLHTCYGNLGHVDAWAARLRERGYVAAVVNSMRARDLDGHFDRLLVCGGRTLRAPDRARDIPITIGQLRTRGLVDGNRIALVGFSHGGWTALDFLAGPPPGAASGVRGVVVVYPYCGDGSGHDAAAWPPDLRTLMLLAGNDTTVGTAGCVALAERQAARGYAVDLHVYPGASHGYDIDPTLIYGYDERYDAVAAADTRRRIVDFLDETLRGPEQRMTSAARTARARESDHVQSSHRRLR